MISEMFPSLFMSSNDAFLRRYFRMISLADSRVSDFNFLAGVGGSPLVNYNGSGAYFLDRLEEGIWRLEVMPDAIFIRDPFERASPKKEVTRIQWTTNQMKITIPDLGTDFDIRGLNAGNSRSASSGSNGFQVSPGTYLLTGKGKRFSR